MTEALKKQFQYLENQVSDLKSEISALKQELHELSSQFFNVRSVSGSIMQSSRIAELLIERIAQDANHRLRSNEFIERIKELVRKGLIPNEIIGSGLHTIRIAANKVRHYKENTSITYADAENILRTLYRIIEWYYCEFAYGPKLPSIYAEPSEKKSIDDKIRDITNQWIKDGKPYPEIMRKDVLIELEKSSPFPELSHESLYLCLLIALHNGHNWKFWFEKASALPDTPLYLVKVIDEGFMRPNYRAAYCLQQIPKEKRTQAIRKHYGKPQPPDYLSDVYEAINNRAVLESLKKELYTADGNRKDKIRILLREFRNLWEQA